MNKRFWMLGTSALVACAGLASGASAQETPPATTAAVDESDDGIRDIVVTAQLRQDNIQDVPVAVSALDAQSLASPMLDDVRDLAGRVPGLVVDSVAAGPSAAAISIRGISFEDIEKSFDPAVGVVVDGVFIGTNTGQLLDSFDMERLEVLRGPQGTLFGRNTIAGVISVKRTRPTEDVGVRGSFLLGNFDTKRARVVVNSGALGDFVRLKGFVFWDKTGGFYRNVTKNKREGEYEVLTGGVTALITPVDGIEAEITYEHMRERGETIVAPLSQTAAPGRGGDLICLVPGAPGFSPLNQCNRFGLPDRGVYTTFGNIDTPVRNDTDAITANIDIELGGGFALKSVTGWRKNDESVRQDFDASSVDFFDTLRNQEYEQFTQELRVQGNVTDWLDLLVGGYYFDSSYTLRQSTRFGVILGQGATPLLQQFTDHSSKSYAGFADARIKVSDRLTIGLGGRYTEDEKRIFNDYGRIAALVNLSLPGYQPGDCVQVTGLLVPGVPRYGAANNCSGNQKFNQFTWRASVDYQIGDNKLVYVSYSKGFRSGGFNGRAASPTSLGPYEPETVDAYEVGLKADWLDRKLRTNIALYRTNYNNKQEEIVQPAPPGASNPQETVVSNASTARIQGAEAEITMQPLRELTITASFAYTDAKFRNFFNDVTGDLIPDDVSTLQLRRAPKYQWATSVDYTRDIGPGTLNLGTVLRYQSKYFTCIAPARPAVVGAVINDPRCQTRDREDLAATIAYSLPVGGGEVKFSVFGRNLTNFRDVASTLPVAGLFTFGTARPPRTYGAEIAFRF
jgi:iron complex outermembrane receptor protein